MSSQPFQDQVEELTLLLAQWVNALQEIKPTFGSFALSLTFNSAAQKSLVGTAMEIQQKASLLMESMTGAPLPKENRLLTIDAFKTMVQQATEQGADTSRLQRMLGEYDIAQQAFIAARGTQVGKAPSTIESIFKLTRFEGDVRWLQAYLKQRLAGDQAEDLRHFLQDIRKQGPKA